MSSGDGSHASTGLATGGDYASRAGRAPALVAALLLLVLVVLIRTAWVSDDAYITFRTVDNFVRGYGLRWNVAERVQAYTHPLWMFVMTALYVVTREPYYTSLALSIVLSLACSAALALLFGASVPGGALALVALISSKAFVDFSTSGLENPLTHALLLLFLWRFFRPRSNAGDLYWLSMVASLAVLNRMDVLLLVAPALALALWQVPSVRALGAVAAGFVPFLVWELFSIVYYGFLFPNTAYAKLSTGITGAELARQGVSYLAESFTHDPVTLTVIIAACILPGSARLRGGWTIRLGILLYGAYIVRVGGDFMSGRFLTAPFVCAVALLACIDWLRFRAWPLMALAVLTLGFAGAHPPLLSGANYGQPRPEPQTGPITDERNVYYAATGLLLAPYQPEIPNHRRARAGRLASRDGTDVVSQSAIGFYGFEAGPRVHVIDLLALADPLLARLPARRPWHIGHFYRRTPEGYEDTLREGRLHIKDPGVAAYYSRLALIVRGDLWGGDRWRAIVRMNLGSYDSLLAGYGLTRLRLADLSEPAGDSAPVATTSLYERGAQIDLGRVVTRGRFEISLDDDDRYRIEFWQARRRVGTTIVGPAAQPTGALAVYDAAIPGGASIDTLSILPIDGDYTYRLGRVRLID